MSDTPSFEQPEHPLDYLPGETVLRIAPDAVRPHLDSTGRLRLTAKEADRLPEAVTGPLDYLRRNAGLKTMQPVLSPRLRAFRHAGHSRGHMHRLAVAASVADVDTPGFAGITTAQLPPRQITPALMKRVAGAKAVDGFERIPARWLTSEPGAPDPVRNLQWGLRVIGWFDADLPNPADVSVGVLDSGVDTRHPGLAQNRIEYDHEGLAKADLLGHGTHVVGTIAATVDDIAGVAGVAHPKIFVWKVMPDEPRSDGVFYIDGERYVKSLFAAALEKPKVVNLSLAGLKPSHDFEQSVINTLREAGAVVVASMGNAYKRDDPTLYPAAAKGVFSVGSIAEDLRRSEFSNTGAHIDLVAPGSNILSTMPTTRSKHCAKRGHAAQSGTSMAAAYVSGAIALLAAKHPDWSGDDLCEHLRQTARKLPGMRGHAWTREYGAGLLDVKAALA